MSIWDERCILAPSLISCCDLCNLEQSVKSLEDGGIGLLHVDILDGHFSPSMPLGLDTVAQLRTRTSMPFDVHLMASENDYFVRELLDIGVEQLVFHATSTTVSIRFTLPARAQALHSSRPRRCPCWTMCWKNATRCC